jgi:NDP-sugar pyrophosphorylase family protein
MHAVILAGGRGQRLAPYTISFPKPLVPVDDMPILEIVLRQLAAAGCTSATLAVGHLAELIISFFGNGENVGIDLTYIREDKPLGTVGPLALMKDLPESFLVMNGDVLTTLDYRQFFDDHVAEGPEVTIACYRKTTRIDLGVVECDGESRITGYREKPSLPYDVSMGVYAFNRSVLDLIPPGQYFDFPNLILKMIEQGRYPKASMSDVIWLDIGRIEDYASATSVFIEHRDKFLPPKAELVGGSQRELPLTAGGAR